MWRGQRTVSLSSVQIAEFFENYMVLNHRNCQFMCIHKNLCDSELLNFNDNILRNCREVEILGITLARNLNFRSHIKKLK